MIAKTFQRFLDLPDVTRSMIGLYWVYEFSQIITWIFLNTFIFLQSESLGFLALYNAFYFTGCLVGFCVFGYFIAQLQISMRLNYLRSFVFYILSFLILLIFPHEPLVLLAFGFFNGLGLGMFWVGVHSYEMLHTDESNRDFYSSMVSTASQVLVIASPFIATITFILSNKYFDGATFTLLLWILPFVYLLSLPFIFKLPDFVPEKISVDEVKRLFLSPSISKARQYWMGTSFDLAIRTIILPVFAITALGNVVNIGILETCVGILSLVAVIVLSHVRNEGNRIQILFYSVLVMSGAYSFLFFADAAWYFYVLFSILYVFIKPIFSVSEHVIALQSVELVRGEDESCFYPGLLYRDFVLWIGRSIAIGVVMFTAWFVQDDLLTAKYMVFFVIASLLLLWVTAKRLVEK